MKRTVISMLAAAVVLSACAPENITPQEHAKQDNSTLNVYADNRVAFKSIQRNSAAFYGWTEKKEDILALQIRGHQYNAKDIVSITFTPQGTGDSGPVAVQLKSGETITATARAYAEGNVAWLVCDTQKNCDAKKSIGDNNFRNNLNGILTGIYASDLDNSHSNPRHNIVRGEYRMIPTIPGTIEVRFLSETEKVNIDNRIGYQQKSFDEAQEKRRIESEEKQAELERRIKSETDDLHKHVHVGSMTNCGQVFDVRLPMVGVQTMNGSQFIDISRLYGPSATCRFINGQYIGR